MHQDALYYLYSELKSSKISLSHAERCPNMPENCIENIKTKIAVIEYLIDQTIKHK